MRTIKLTFTVLIALLLLATTSCTSTKGFTTQKDAPCSEFQKKQRDNSKRIVKVLDSLSKRFNNLTLQMSSSDKSFDQLFDDEMKTLGDSLDVVLTSVFDTSDKWDACTADKANSNWRPFTLYVDDARQERTRELLTQLSGMKANFNDVVTEVVQLSKLNFYLLRGEPISVERMAYLNTAMKRYNTIDANTQTPAYKQIQNKYLVQVLKQTANQSFYPSQVAKDFRVKYAVIVLKANLRERMLKSRLENNR